MGRTSSPVTRAVIAFIPVLAALSLYLLQHHYPELLPQSLHDTLDHCSTILHKLLSQLPTVHRPNLPFNFGFADPGLVLVVTISSLTLAIFTHRQFTLYATSS